MVSVMTTDGDVGVKDGHVASWIKMYKNYLVHGTQHENGNEARTLRMKSSRFRAIDDVLFKKNCQRLVT